MVHGVTDEELRAAVASSRSWRAVLREVGRTSPRVGRDLRARCDELGVDYAHFRAGPSDEVVRSAVTGSRTWTEAVVAAGYGELSGSARAQLRKRSVILGLSTAHLEQMSGGLDVAPRLEHLRDAGAYLVAGFLAMCGYRVSWPLEPAAYDLVVDMPSGLQRVQVKTSTRRENGSWRCWLTRSVYDGASGCTVAGLYGRGDLDYFGVVDGDLAVYLIPYAEVEGQGTVQLRKYASFRLAPPHAERTIR